MATSLPSTSRHPADRTPRAASAPDGVSGTAPTIAERQPLPVPELPPRLIMDLRGDCNLKCPMCPVHGSDNTFAIEISRGTMTLENARKLLDEMEAAHPLVQPAMYGEPTLSKELREHILQMKERGMAVALNTNGLLMKPDLAQFFVDNKVDSVFFSVDAMTPDILKKVRGVTQLEKIQKAVFLMLKTRGNSEFPRIGVSMTVQDANRFQRDEFIKYWVQHVDCVRIDELYHEGKFDKIAAPRERVPCKALYYTMPVHFDGKVSICCLDGFGETDMGNVFKDGVKAVWHGEKFTEVRHLHETGQYDKVPFCKDCNGWTGYVYEEEIDGDVLIRRSAQHTYYNRFDRLDGWSGNRLGGHVSPTVENLLKTLEDSAEG